MPFSVCCAKLLEKDNSFKLCLSDIKFLLLNSSSFNAFIICSFMLLLNAISLKLSCLINISLFFSLVLHLSVTLDGWSHTILDGWHSFDLEFMSSNSRVQ